MVLLDPYEFSLLSTGAFHTILTAENQFEVSFTQEGAFGVMVRFTSTKSNFYPGESIELEVMVSAPRTKSPVDPVTVTLEDLVVEDTMLTVAGFTPIPFDKIKVGQYALTLETDTLAEGEYRMFVHLVDGDHVTIARDRFILAELNPA